MVSGRAGSVGSEILWVETGWVFSIQDESGQVTINFWSQTGQNLKAMTMAMSHPGFLYFSDRVGSCLAGLKNLLVSSRVKTRPSPSKNHKFLSVVVWWPISKNRGVLYLLKPTFRLLGAN